MSSIFIPIATLIELLHNDIIIIYSCNFIIHLIAICLFISLHTSLLRPIFIYLVFYMLACLHT